MTADLDAQRIISQARRRADEIRAKADGSVYAAYAKAYETAPDFYDFFKTLDFYKTAINGNTTLMVKANSHSSTGGVSRRRSDGRPGCT